MHIMADCTSSTVKEYALTNAILLYKDLQSRQAVFASVHEVRHKKEVVQIEAGQPVSKIGLLELMKTLCPEDVVQPELFGDHILSSGAKHLVWWCKPQQRTMFFKGGFIGEGEISGVTDQPGLVFVVAHGAWYVFAVKSRSRPKASTPLYPAPFPNVWSSGAVCVGNIDLPKGVMRFNTTSWEGCFYRSFFTHSNYRGEEKQTNFKGGIYALWRVLLKGKKFSNDWLPKSQETLGTVFERTVLNES